MMVTRRRFQHLTLFTIPFVYVAGFAAAAFRFLSPLPAKARDPSLDAGAVEDYAPGKPAKTFEFNGRLVYVFHDGTSIRAFDAQCPHLGCNVLPPHDALFRCTCHGARFDYDGHAQPNGPTRDPLREYRLGDLAAGRVTILDQTKSAS